MASIQVIVNGQAQKNTTRFHVVKGTYLRVFMPPPLILCLLLHAFLSYADVFSKSSFSKNSLRNAIRVTNSLDPDQVC